MARSKEFNEARNNVALDNTFDRWVLLFRQELAELHRRIQLTVRIIGKYASNHLIRELEQRKFDKHEKRVLEALLTGASQLPPPTSSSESAPAEGKKLRRLEIFSSLF